MPSTSLRRLEELTAQNVALSFLAVKGAGG